MNPLFNTILFIHIFFGFTALSAAAGAISTKKGATPHRLCGKVFVIAMSGIVLSAIPLSIMKHDIFLFLIAIFSYYFAISGFLFATNHTGKPSRIAWISSSIMLTIGILMLIYSYFSPTSNSSPASVLVIFGIIACITGYSDLKLYRTKPISGTFRIIKHLTAMLGATIATLTAFTVVNFHTNPAIIAWITPTLLIVPIILWWRIKLSR